jgi:predicted ATPase
MEKYVITGGPGIGKTTVIEILASMDYEIVPESARIVIEEEKAKNSGILPWIDLARFQEKVLEKQLESEEKINRLPAFLDRGIVDGHGYCKNGEIETPSKIFELGKNRYEKIFILEPLSNYQNDSARLENLEEAQKVHESIVEAYKEFEYEIIFVPIMKPEERVKFILDNL